VGHVILSPQRSLKRPTETILLSRAIVQGAIPHTAHQMINYSGNLYTHHLIEVNVVPVTDLLVTPGLLG